MKIAIDYLEGGIGEQSVPRAKLESQSGKKENYFLLIRNRKSHGNLFC